VGHDRRVAKRTSRLDELKDAVQAHDLARVTALLDRPGGAEAGIVNARGDNVLMWAMIVAAPLPVVDALVVRGGANLAHTNKEGLTPITYAQWYLRDDIVARLGELGHRVQPIEKWSQKQRDAWLLRTVLDWTDERLAARLVRLLRAGANAEVRFEGRRTALHLLALQGAKDVYAYRALLDAGADIAIRDPEGSTPLHLLASHASELEPARLLIERGASLEATDARGRTPLHVARESGYWNKQLFVDMLVAAGADTAREAPPPRPVDPAIASLRADLDFFYEHDEPRPGSPHARFLAVTRNVLHKLQLKAGYLPIGRTREEFLLFDYYQSPDFYSGDDLPKRLAAKLRAQKWIPFGYSGNNFAIAKAYDRDGSGGTLFVDLEHASQADAPVIYLPDTVSRTNKLRTLTLPFRALLAAKSRSAKVTPRPAARRARPGRPASRRATARGAGSRQQPRRSR
jgi:ankyrin repeat protein